MAAKRFTDSSKWRNEWFRTLPQKAKLTWSYLCDECDFSGIWKADFGLASFQLDFKIEAADLKSWFGSKIHFFETDLFLIVPFFEFQYGQSKDTWTAKIKARERLEALGFEIINNKVQIPQSPTVDDPGGSVLIVGVGKGVGKVDIGESEGSERTVAEFFVDYWNSQIWPLPKVSKLTADRRAKIRARLSEAPIEEWELTIHRIHQSDFLLGKRSSWKADFDWLISNESIRIKINEGKYDNNHPQGPAPFDPMTAPLRGVS